MSEQQAKRKSLLGANGNLWVVAAIAAIVILAGIITYFARFADSDVLAKVDGEKITKEELYDAMFNQFSYSGAKIGEQTLDQMIDTMLIRQKADKEGIEVTDKQLDAAVQKEFDAFVANFGSEEQLAQMLSQGGMSIDDLKSDLRKDQETQLRLKALFADKIEITDEEIKTYYDENKESFQEPEKIQASHILVDTKEKAEELLKQLKDGADFAELAKEHSKDGSASQGGALGGFYERGELYPEFEEAAFALEVGALSGVVESEAGFHIIKLTDKQAPVTYSLEEKKEEIRETLFQQEMNGQLQGYLDQLRSEAEIERNV